MGFAPVYITENDGTQNEVDRILFEDGDVTSESDTPVSQMIIDSPILVRSGRLSKDDGESFVRSLASAYSGSRLRVGRYINGAKTFCPTGAGGGRDPHCGSSGEHGGPHSELVSARYNKKAEKWELSNGKALPSHLPKRIPPAWSDVYVSLDSKASLLVKGRDVKGRVQSVYSLAHAEDKKAIKFVRVNELRGKQDAVRSEIYHDMKDPAKKEAASVLALIEHTGLRPGGEGDTKAEKQAYGATTLEARHVEVSQYGVRLKFVGKKGVDLNIKVTDPKMQAMLKERKQGADKPRAKLFDTDAAKLREYADSKDGGGFLPKDFRTAKGTNTAVEEIARMPRPTNEKEYKKAVKAVAEVVSKQLGNTPTIALQSYIDPAVFAKWRLK